MFRGTFLLKIFYLVVVINFITIGNGYATEKNKKQLSKNDEFFANFVEDKTENTTNKEVIDKNTNNVEPLTPQKNDEIDLKNNKNSTKDNKTNTSNNKNTEKQATQNQKSNNQKLNNTNNNKTNTNKKANNKAKSNVSIKTSKTKSTPTNKKTTKNNTSITSKTTKNSSINNKNKTVNASNSNKRINNSKNQQTKQQTVNKNNSNRSNSNKNNSDKNNKMAQNNDNKNNKEGDKIKKNKENEIKVSELIVKEEEIPLKLYNLIDLALERNLQTKQAYINVKLLEYDLMVAKSNFYPSISGSGSFSAVDGDRYNDVRKSLNGDISLKYNIFAFGKYMFNVNAVKHSLQAVKYEEDEKIQDIIFNVVENYYNLLSLKAEKNVVMDDKNLSYETYKSANLKYKLGLVPLADKLKANTTYSQKKVDAVRIENEIKKQEANLNIILNLDPNYILYVENPEINVELTNKNIEYFLNEAKNNRPDLKSLKEIRKQKEQELKQAKTEFLPEVNLGGSIGISKDISKGSDKKNIKEESISLGITVPIFDGFSDVARVKRKNNEIKMLDLQIEELEKQISNEVWSCYQDFNTNQATYLASKDLVESAEENAKLSLGMYKNGRASILEVLDSQNQLKEAKLEFVKSKYNWIIYKIKLLKTIGKMSLDNIINVKEW